MDFNTPSRRLVRDEIAPALLGLLPVGPMMLQLYAKHHPASKDETLRAEAVRKYLATDICGLVEPLLDDMDQLIQTLENLLRATQGCDPISMHEFARAEDEAIRTVRKYSTARSSTRS